MATFTFIQQLWYEHPGVESIAAVLRENGHFVDVIIGTSASKIAAAIKPGSVAAIPVMTGAHHWAVDTAREIKKKSDSLVILGGPHATYFPEIINEPGIDIISRGESEYAVLELAQAIDAGRNITGIRNLWVKKDDIIHKNPLRPLIDNLDDIPHPYREMYYNKYPSLRNTTHKIFLAGRGCPFNCTFCFNANLKDMYRSLGCYVRFRSPQNIIDEIAQVRRAYPLKTVFFNDDIFILNQKWLESFLPLFKKKIDLPFYTCARADTLTEDIAKMLKDAGCQCVSFAIESGNEQIRNNILAKKITNDQIIRAASILKKHKIRFAAYNMVGIPGETPENIIETIDLNIKIKTDYPRCSFLTPYPGTLIEKYARDNGYISQTDNEINATSQQNESLIKNDRINEIINLHDFFQLGVKCHTLMPLIKKLSKLPPNPIFKIVWYISYFIIFTRSEGRSMKETFIFAINSFKTLFHRKKNR